MLLTVNISSLELLLLNLICPIQGPPRALGWLVVGSSLKKKKVSQNNQSLPFAVTRYY